MGILADGYQLGAEFQMQDILLRLLEVQKEKSIGPAEILVFLNRREKAFQGKLVDVLGQTAVLAVGKTHFLFNVDQVIAISVVDGEEVFSRVARAPI